MLGLVSGFGLGFRLGIRCRAQHNTHGFVTHIYTDTQSHETHLHNTQTHRSPGLYYGVWALGCATDIWVPGIVWSTAGIGVYGTWVSWADVTLSVCVCVCVCVCVWYFGTMGLR